VPGLFLSGLPLALVLVPLAVIILGKGRSSAGDSEPNERLVMPLTEWIWKLAIIAVVYPVLYFSFGYFVAWQNPNVVAMYEGGANQEVFSLWLIPFQMLRSMLWVLFALPVIRMARGRPWQVAVVVGLLYALVHAISLTLPNPYMPDPTVRLTHFVEIISSNFIFGLIVTGLLLWRPGRVPGPSGPIVKPQTGIQ
jgi:hypothetical protein